jgi:hypothetical protein
MKKLIITRAITCITLMFLVGDAACQPYEDIILLNSRNARLPGSMLTPGTSSHEYINNISTKAVRGFLKDYKYARNVTWRKARDGGYLAQFTTDSIQTTVAYNNKGSWMYTLKKYGENRMSRELRTLIKRAYFDYDITEVTQIKLPGQMEGTIFRVLIKNDGNFKIVHICNNEMEVRGDYTKP